jgi:hypothetical protein
MSDDSHRQGEYLKAEYASQALAAEGHDHLSLSLGPELLT